MNKEEIIEYINLHCPDEDIFLADGFDEAFLGIGQQFNTFFAVYDKFKCIQILSENMSIEEAEEYFSYNVIGAYFGKNTPVFIDNCS